MDLEEIRDTKMGPGRHQGYQSGLGRTRWRWVLRWVLDDLEMMDTRMSAGETGGDDEHQNESRRVKESCPGWILKDQEELVGAKVGLGGDWSHQEGLGGIWRRGRAPKQVQEKLEEMMRAKMGPGGSGRDDGLQDGFRRSRRR